MNVCVYIYINIIWERERKLRDCGSGGSKASKLGPGFTWTASER